MADYEYDDSGSEVEEGGKKQRASTAGRKLMRWNPDVDQFVLLAVDIVCSEQGTPVPWEFVADKLNGFTTGESIKQHLAKVRKFREQAGRPVPQRTTKNGKGEPAAYGGGTSTATQKKKDGRNGKKVAPLTGKGASLLWNHPKQKPAEPRVAPAEMEEVREVKKEKAKPVNKKASISDDTALDMPKTPVKKSRKGTVKAEPEGEEKAASKKKSIGKRSRPKKELSVKSDDEDEESYVDDRSPAQKPRNLRATYSINYDESQTFGEDEEEIFEARSRSSSDDFYGDSGYSSQAATVKKSGDSHSTSRKSSDSMMQQPPPNFENMLQSRTGTNSFGDEYIGGDQASNFPGVFTGLNNSYGPTDFGGAPNMGAGAVEMSMNLESQLPGLFPPTADQLQMQAHNGGYGNYGRNTGKQHAQAHSGEPAAPARKVRKQEGRGDAKAQQKGSATPSGTKKSKKKGEETPKQQSTKRDKDRKQRKHSVMQDSKSVGPPSSLFNDYNEQYGNIQILNDTGRGIDQFSNNGAANFSLPPISSYDPQQSQPLTTSPTEISNNGFMNGLPSTPNNNVTFNNSTGITPAFNKFGFDSNPDRPVPTTEFDFNQNFNENYTFGNTNGGYSDHGTGGFNSANTSFSSSNDSSQADRSMVGLGMYQDAFMPRMGGSGMGTDMTAGGDNDDDIFSMTNTEEYGY